MSSEFDPRHLNVQAFAQTGSSLSSTDSLSKYERLMAETGASGADREVRWTARGEQQTDASGHARVWLHLEAGVSLPLTCQRCLGPADVEVSLARDFRFVVTEEQAELEDEASEEDVLVLSRDFDLTALVEDELLMAMPLVPRHAVCPGEVKLMVQDPDFEAASAAKPKPFAALAGLKVGKTG